MPKGAPRNSKSVRTRTPGRYTQLRGKKPVQGISRERARTIVGDRGLRTLDGGIKRGISYDINASNVRSISRSFARTMAGRRDRAVARRKSGRK